jgi:two-component system, sensor histidine kinase and response regulator
MINSTLKNANILIIDDQEANIDILESVLLLQGYMNIKSTTDARDFIYLFNSFKPDLILLDLTMPYMSGFEVLEQLKSLSSVNTFLPVLILTADVTPQAKQLALSSGAHDFLTKPFDLVEVGLRIKNLLFTCHLHQQLYNQNIILEELVKERTSELEKTNRELIASNDRAQASDRLKTAFIQNISHEIRTPLNGILGFGTLLAEPDITEEDKQYYFDLMQTSSIRLTNTITNYMDISLIVSDNMEVNSNMINVNNKLKKIKTKFQPLSDEKNLSLILSIPEDQREHYIQTDPELLLKIISHLLDNAIKFTHEGFITLGYTVKKEIVEFYVKDTGIGIDADAQERIFDSFIQGDTSNTREYEGSGLGLTISNKMAQMIGGHIWFQSKKGEGSIFYFSLSKYEILNDPNNNNNNITFDNVDEYPFKNLKILIVEDDEISAIFLKEIVRKFCKDFILVRNGLEAIDACLNHPDIDLILMDIKMPKMDGYEATRQIRKFNKDVIIIAQTAYALKGDREKAMKAGCNDYSAKPINQNLIMELINMHINK